MARTLRLVIGVEAIIEAGGEWLVPSRIPAQDEGLVEPGRMRQMPLGRAGVVHRLDDLVLICQRFGEFQRQVAAGHQTGCKTSIPLSCFWRFRVRLRMPSGRL